MKIFIRLTGILMLVSCLISCNPHSGQLKDIDRIMESDPEVVLVELGQIDRKDLTPVDSAYYALLYTQAMIKCGIVVSSDSLIRTAYRMFGDGEDGDLKTRTCLYNAMIAYNRGDMTAAMKDAMTAYATAKEEESPCWIARSAELIGDIFYYVYNYHQAEPYKSEAAEHYLRAGKKANHRYALCDLASVYLNEDKVDKAMNLLDSLDITVRNEVPVDSALLDYISTARMSGLFNTGRFEEIIPDSLLGVDGGNSVDEGIDLAVINSRLEYEAGNTLIASSLLTDAYGISQDDRQRIRVNYEKYRQCMASGKYRDAAMMADTLLFVQSKIAEDLLKESVTGVQRDFYSEKARYQEQRTGYILRMLVLVIVAAIIITGLLVWIYRLRLKTATAELESNILSLDRLRREVENITTENGRLSEALNEKSAEMEVLHRNRHNETETETEARMDSTNVIEYLFREKWSTLNMLCKELFCLDDSEATRNMALNNIRKELDKLRTKKGLASIETAVDMYMGGYHVDVALRVCVSERGGILISFLAICRILVKGSMPFPEYKIQTVLSEKIPDLNLHRKIRRPS